MLRFAISATLADLQGDRAMAQEETVKFQSASDDPSEDLDATHFRHPQNVSC